MIQTFHSQITQALHRLSTPIVLTNKAVDQLIKDLSLTLIQADVNVRLVKSMMDKIKRIDIDSLPSGINKRKWIIQQVGHELLHLLGGTQLRIVPPAQKKGHVLLFVGLNGAGKTTTCCKYAYHFKKRGKSVALIAADCFRAGAFDQLKQNALLGKIPFYGSYTERDPAAIARHGIEIFQNEMNFILIDSAGRNKQDAALMEEMKELVHVSCPDEIIYVIDASIGQSAKEQALAFHEAIPLTSIILTKMDGTQVKGGGALSAIAETKIPVTYIGTGEHMHQLEPFDPQRFVARLMGQGDVQGLLESLNVSAKDDHKDSLLSRLQGGKVTFTFRDLYEQITSLKDVPFENLVAMFPQASTRKLPDNLSKAKLKQSLVCIDSMTPEELDSDGKLFTKQPSRKDRICRGAGVTKEQFSTMLQLFKMFADTLRRFKGFGHKLHLGKGMPGNSSADMQGLLTAAQGIMKGNGMKLSLLSKRIQ